MNVNIIIKGTLENHLFRQTINDFDESEKCLNLIQMNKNNLS